MTIETHCADRKELVRAISEHLNVPAVYQYTPTYAYVIGDLTVDRDGNIIGTCGALDSVREFLAERGYTDAVQLESPDTTWVTINFPESDLTAQTAINLLRMLYSRQQLICRMMKSDTIALDEECVTRLEDEHAATVADALRILEDCIQFDMAHGIELTEKRFSLELAADPDFPSRTQFGSVLMLAMLDKCRAAKRVTATLLAPDESEMKYYARGWLLQLGRGGADYAAFRHAMLDHLKGYAAFRKLEEMNAHNARYAEIRKQRRENA